VLDLYQGVWEGETLGPNDYVISADEKTSIQAANAWRKDKALLQVGSDGGVRVRTRRGLAYVAAWDVRRASVRGMRSHDGNRTLPSPSGPGDGQEPYRSARGVLDRRQCSFAPGRSIEAAAREVVRERDSGPHACSRELLNQIEIYSPVVQRKVLTPNEFPISRQSRRAHGLPGYYETIARPFEWKFTRADLDELLAKLARQEQQKAVA